MNSIDTIYQYILNKLRDQEKIEDISKTLHMLTTKSKRVLYVYDVIEILNVLPQVIKVPKCQKVSTHYRNLGNKVFAKSQDYEAWQYYNLSLMYAPVDTDSYSLALSNRSAVFFSLKKYEECLRDITGVFSLNYPQNLKEKLEKRRASCTEALAGMDLSQTNESPDVNDILSLKGRRDDEFVCASSRLEVVFDPHLGRHVIAKQDIKVGEVLAIEQPYLLLLLKPQILFYCSYCLSRKPNLLPCDFCCYALYCSKECKDAARREYHEVECPLMATLLHMQFSKLELLALRTVIKARTDHRDWSNLFYTMAEADEKRMTSLVGHVVVNSKWVYDSKYYGAIHTLATNEAKRSMSEIFQKSVSAAVILSLLSKGTDFLMSDGQYHGVDIRKCVAGLLLIHLMTSPTNMHGITSNIQNAEGHYLEETNIGCAPYAFHSLLNHSCAPNVVRFSKVGSGKMTLFALRPIKKGMQLYDNYGAHHAIENRRGRQETLSFQYKFDCACEACVDDWPTYLALRSPMNLPLSIRQTKDKLLNSTNLSKLQGGDLATALKLFKPLCKLAEDLDPFAPCTELADCQESLKQCIVIFVGLVPYGYSKLIQWNVIPPKC